MQEKRHPKDILDAITLYTIEKGILYFHEIEKLSDCIIMEMMNEMMSTLNAIQKPKCFAREPL